jgi:hypothetical protein
MISYKVSGLEEMVKRLRDTKAVLPAELIDKAVKSASTEIKANLKLEYKNAGLYGKGNLINSIDTFRRKRKSRNDPYFTYYVGPKYGPGGGNHAHFFEYGVLYSAYPVKGKGMTIGGRKYGKFVAKDGYRIKPYGIVRMVLDKNSAHISTKLGQDIYTAILDNWEKRGGKFYKK